MKNLMMVVTHKNCQIVEDPLYQPVVVGKGQVEIDNAWRDNTLDNIAEKNPYYCELTAQYWVWKNQAANYDTVGLCHYRRYFTKKRFSNHPSALLTGKDIDRVMKNYDVILAKPFIWQQTVEKVYYAAGMGKKKDLELTAQAIQTLYPEYLDSYNCVLQSMQGSYCNMFVMTQKHFAAYCQWLFSILQYVEEHIDMTGYSVQEQRVFGYLSEILLNVWVHHNQMRIKYYPIAYMELSAKQHIKHAFREFHKNIKLALRRVGAGK